MEREQDLLAEWKQKVSMLKFKLGRANDKIFADAINTESVLRNFFNKADYTITKNAASENNYLIYLLANVKQTEIHLLNEMAQLITHAASIKQRVALKAKNNAVNHEGLSNALFELYIDSFLRSKSIEINENAEYVNEIGNTKPLDSHFYLVGQEYLVECFRLADADALSLMHFNLKLMRLLTKQKIFAYQAFRGHIGFKTTKNLSSFIDVAREKIGSIYAAYLNAFQGTDGQSILIPGRLSTPNYEIDIAPYDMSASHEAEWDTGSYNTLLTFCIGPKPDNPQTTGLTIQVKRQTTNKDINDKLFDKIKRKRRQHASFKENKLFFIEIDLTFGSNPNNPVLVPISSEQLDTSRYRELVEKDESLIFAFVFKKAADEGISRVMRFLYHPKHQSLVDRLKLP
jgi:hypothetical protein